MQGSMKAAGFTVTALLLILGPLLPGPTAAKDKDYLEGKILDTEQKKQGVMSTKHDCHDGTSGQCDHIFLDIQVEDMLYRIDYEHHRGMVGMGEYKYKEEDWPINSVVKLRFETKHVLGLRRTYVFVKGPKDKEIKFFVVSKTGPDGKEYCGNYRC